MTSTLRDIPFIARQSARDPRQTRELLGLPSDRPVVLASFGGYGLRLPLDEVARSGRFFVVSTDRMAPEGEDASLPNLVRLGDREVFARGLRYEDLVAAADLVVSKPGYGIVSECIANNTAFLYTSRGRFPEYDVFVAEMPRLLRCRYISQADLLAGRWEDAVDALLRQPPAAAHPLINGADAAADDLLDLLAPIP